MQSMEDVEQFPPPGLQDGGREAEAEAGTWGGPERETHDRATPAAS